MDLRRAVMSINPQISLGDVATVLIVAISVLGMHRSNVARMSKFESRLDIIFAWFERNVINGPRS